jgi:tyrosyl-tRNA synthetase
MMAKDSVKKRIDGTTGTGMSFTEFSYQLIQGYDFFHLYKEKKCMLQMGGSDQWGNITTGTEFIRRKAGGHAFALTTQLITKADGSKFGKSESGNIWLDAKKTSPYKFYQFWLNTSDDDAKKYIRYFTLLNKEEIEALDAEHDKAPHLRVLQKALAKDITVRVHSEADYNSAVEASEILFKGTIEQLGNLDEQTFLDVFDGVPLFEVKREELETGINIVDFLTATTTVFPSKGEARKMIVGGGVSLNKQKIETETVLVNACNLINSKYLLIQKGKKNYFLAKV